MGNVNTLRNQKSAVHQKKEYVLNDIQLKIQQNLNKQKKSVNSQSFKYEQNLMLIWTKFIGRLTHTFLQMKQNVFNILIILLMQIHPIQAINTTTKEDSQIHINGSEEKLLKTKQTILDRSPVNQEALNTYLKSTHPTDPDDKFYDCSNCYDVDVGFNCCCSTEFQSDINQYGAGITIYFRFLKQIILYFLLFAIMSIPQLIFSLSCVQDTLTLNSMLMGTTLGSLSLQGDSCIKKSWDDVIQNNDLTLDQATILQKTTFQCKSGTISAQNFVLGFIQEDRNSIPCTQYDPSQAITNCTNLNAFAEIQNQCIGYQSCEFIIKESLFDNCPNMHKDHIVYAYSFCQDSEFSIGSISIKNNTVSIICAYIDLAIILISTIFLFTLERQEQETMKNVNESEVFVENFSLEFQNLPECSDPRELFQKLIEIELQLAKKFPQISSFHIVDIQFSKGNKSVLIGEERAQTIKKRNNLVRRFENKFKVSVVTSMDLKQNLATAVLTQTLSQLQQKDNAQELIGEIEKLENQISDYDNQIQEPEELNEIIKYAWITFETIEQRNMAFFVYQQDYLRDLFSCCGCNEILKIDNAIIKAQPAPPPDDINWMNLQYSTIELIARRTLSFMLTFVLMIFTIAAIIFLKLKQLDYQSNYPEPNCTMYSKITENDVIDDQQKKNFKQGLLECYCKEDFLNRINMTFSNGEQLCQQWFNDYVKIVGWPFLIVIVIIFINQVIQLIFTKFAEFEAHRSKSKQLSSRLLKVFIVQYINTALVILIINIKFTSELNLSSFSVWLNGKFDDINVQWFNQVGTTILLTMVIYIIGPLINIMISSLIRCFKKCFDQCGLDEGQFTKKLTQQDLNEYYTGSDFNVELKYSQILTVICVNFLYSSGMPLLYLTTALFLFITFCSDKYYLLHFCKIPPKVDDSIAKLVRQILKLLLIWHTIFSIWIYGSTKLFPETVDFTKSIQSSSIVQNAQNDVFGEFFTRAITSQCIGLTCMLILLILYYILWPYLISPILKTIFFFCYSESTLFDKVENTFISMQQSLYELYSQNQGNQLKELLRIQRQDAQQKGQQQFALLMGERLARLQALKFFKGLINGLHSYDIVLNPKYSQYHNL
ncbi:unnamed protein product [Paramecium sonneborni]|uniref:Transmembrane protein n=1 Tax=Paramecium sonneborni TaxID=65129 RepID=A0A8S1NK24_9CILI|nr:unnamed protein product [Paramecium sonneborni]